MKIISVCSCLLCPGVAPGIFRRGADSSDEGAKIWFSGYHKYQKSPKNCFSPSDGGGLQLCSFKSISKP